MSNLCTIIEFIQNLCAENVEMNNMLKEVDKINRENSKLESQLDELDREHVRLQIDLFNLETIISNTDISAIKNVQQTSMKMYQNIVELHNLIKKIDFTKILQCYHMEMEAKCQSEWQPIKDSFAKTLKWHKQMEERHIVQKYNQTQIVCRQAEEAYKNQQESMKKSSKKSLELIKQANERQNELIVFLVKGSKDLNNLKIKMKKLNQYQVYIENLRQEKFKLANQLEQTHLKAFNPTLSLTRNQHPTTKLKPNNEACNFIMPILPTFTDILKSFNQTEKTTNITAVENVTNYCVKSILHTSSRKQSITTKQTKNVCFKLQLKEYQEEMIQNFYNNEIESESDIEINVQAVQKTVDINENEDMKHNLREIKDLADKSQIEIVDLLTPSNTLIETVKENKDVIESSGYNLNTKNPIVKKPLIEIQDCIIFKTPFPIQEISNTENKENDSNNIMHSCSKQSNDIYSSNSSHMEIKEILNTTKKSIYEDFLSISSAESSPIQNNKNISFTKDFEAFFNETKNEDIKVNVTSNNFVTNQTTKSDIQDFLDFDSNKSFTLDSDANMTDNYNTGNMDFM